MRGIHLVAGAGLVAALVGGGPVLAQQEGLVFEDEPTVSGLEDDARFEFSWKVLKRRYYAESDPHYIQIDLIEGYTETKIATVARFKPSNFPTKDGREREDGVLPDNSKRYLRVVSGQQLNMALSKSLEERRKGAILRFYLVRGDGEGLDEAILGTDGSVLSHKDFPLERLRELVRFNKGWTQRVVLQDPKLKTVAEFYMGYSPRRKLSREQMKACLDLAARADDNTGICGVMNWAGFEEAKDYEELYKNPERLGMLADGWLIWRGHASKGTVNSISKYAKMGGMAAKGAETRFLGLRRWMGRGMFWFGAADLGLHVGITAAGKRHAGYMPIITMINEHGGDIDMEEILIHPDPAERIGRGVAETIINNVGDQGPNPKFDAETVEKPRDEKKKNK